MNNDYIAAIQENRKTPLEEGEIAEIEQWHRGQELRNIINTEAWVIIVDTLKSYVASSNAALMALPVGDPAVPNAHAAASGVEQLVQLFEQDIDAAVRASYETPYALRKQ